MLAPDDDCFYYHSWRNSVVIAFGTLSSLKVVLLNRGGAKINSEFHPDLRERKN